MGGLASRQNAGIEEVDTVSNLAYKYPPKSGNYFGSHFIMGGERFDTPEPEAYLFGENADLNFLGSRPTPFPYPPPQASEPTKTLKSLVNIRKESLKFVRPPDEKNGSNGYNIEFTFDCDARCSITIHYFATEEYLTSGMAYVPRDPNLSSEPIQFKRGAGQTYVNTQHVFDPSKFSNEELLYSPEKEVIPVAIHCIVDEGPEEVRQSHTTIAVVEHHSDGTYVLKALKQKLFVDGLCYLLQEIYGIENKNNELAKMSSQDEPEDGGCECVICMCDVRDTLILPCRHLCLCNACADSLRYQANNCPICRSPFRALLQIRALQKSSSHSSTENDNIPPGYEAVSLIEALNGPHATRPNPPLDSMAETPDSETNGQAAQILNRSNIDCSTLKSNKSKLNSSDASEVRSITERSFSNSKLRMSVLLAREEEKSSGRSSLPRDKSAILRHPRDSVSFINEKQQDETGDEDSEAEKLSPLLDAATSTDNAPSVPSLDCSPQDSNHSQEKKSPDKDEEFYTPDDTSVTVLTSVPEKNRSHSNGISCVMVSRAWPGGVSLPGTPLSSSSHRSSGDSYSSNCSSKLLLTSAAEAPTAATTKITN
ncbi:unnamed protein product [Bemisia tabaci]|uniref:RING-type E3 ubiquitin transferase n=1 Tax=Bemisia tabaci TaxID=7038 RepID=A0A9P0A2W9_BEMTA|nr:unnamed protein product [Bemisia tabaci]